MKKGRIFCCAAVVLAVCLGVSLMWLKWSQKQEVKHFTAFMAVQRDEEGKKNRIKDKISELTGVQVDVQWLAGQEASERLERMIQTGELPDFIDGSDATNLLLEADVLVPLEGYLEDFPNLKRYFSEEEWESLRKEDGHIYFIPQFNVVQGHETSTITSDEAFWIQKRVLEWAGYPKLKTLDDYFDLILGYLEEHPVSDGKPNIGFEILCDGWRYFCLENPPMFLAGYPNDGCAVVDPVTQKASVYDTLPEAKQYYQKLCEVYNQGGIDPETFTLSYSQYLDRLRKGNVLGFVDQYWDMMSVQNSLYAQGREDRTYVPFAITASESITGNYNCVASSLNVGGGLAVTKACSDVEGALAFIDQLLSPEIMKLRYWGEEGIDYQVGEDGVFYRTDEQRKLRENGEYQKANFYEYPYFPTYAGMLADGINTVLPDHQPGEYYTTLSSYDQKILDAYGYKTWKEFTGPLTEGEPWFPLYSCITDWPTDSAYGKARENMEEVKRNWLPKVIMSSEKEFGENWSAYMSTYRANVDVEAYEAQLDLEIQKRIRSKE